MYATGRVAGFGSSASHLPGLLGPALAALITTGLYEGRPGLARLVRRALTIPRARGYAALAILTPPVVALCVLALTAHPFPPFSDFFLYPGLPAGTPWYAVLGLVFVLNGWGEELGWRGWLQPELMRRHSRLGATLAVAAIWASWHIPLFAVNAQMHAMLGPGLIGWLIGLVLGAVVLAHVTLTTDSLLVAALWHTAFNFAVATAATGGTSAAVVSTLVMVWGAGIVYDWQRRRPVWPLEDDQRPPRRPK
jgi:membrane protease YdiL (CAAX protease family)